MPTRTRCWPSTVAEDDLGLLRRGCLQLGLGLSESQLAQLLAYTELLRRWNPQARLVSDRDLDRLVARHLLDSLSALTALPAVAAMDPPTLLDFGSGGGLPGIPIAICRGDLRVTLVERQQRKARFLRRVGRELGLGNLQVHGADLATLERPAAGYGVAVSRAVADPVTLWQQLAGYLAADGFLLALSRVGVPERDDGEARALAPLRAQSRWLSVPGLREPHQLLRIDRPAGAA